MPTARSGSSFVRAGLEMRGVAESYRRPAEQRPPRQEVRRIEDMDRMQKEATNLAKAEEHIEMIIARRLCAGMVADAFEVGRLFAQAKDESQLKRLRERTGLTVEEVAPLIEAARADAAGVPYDENRLFKAFLLRVVRLN
jgi:hypothetical protein